MDLQDALFTSQLDEMDCVIEVESSINANAKFHSTLKQFTCQAADHALRTLSRLSVLHQCRCQIHEMKFSLYRIKLSDRPTSSYIEAKHHDFYREGFILSLTLEDGSVGYGEVAPLEIHKESMLDAEDQLRFLLHVLKGANISSMLPLLRGSFSSWIWSALGIPACSLFPSVRCGLEMALLNAISVGQGCNLSSILNSQIEKEETIDRASSVEICALVDSGGSPEEIAYVASKLVEEGFTAIKLKVARCLDPTQDAEVIQKVRKKVGDQIKLRVDANRRWTYEEAMKFSNLVKSCDLQYIEEPVKDQDDIIKYCEESGLLVALDETLDDFQEDYLNLLRKYTHPGIVALVIKPSVVGGFENAALLARWAQQHGKMAVVSAAYESGLGLSAYIQFSYYLELQNADICRQLNRKMGPPVAHGLGTYRWLKEDVMTEPLGISRNPCSGYVEASVVDSNRILQNFQINQNTVCKTSTEEQVRRYQLTVDTEDVSYSVQVHEIGQTVNENVVLFLHGFLGNGEDWIPIMKGISGFARCVSIDLPGHGRTQNLSDKETSGNSNLSFEMIGDVLFEVIRQISSGKVTLVGYSMGARIALYMALRMKNKIEGTVVVSGSPGLKDGLARKIRRAKDDSRARALVAHGLELFVDDWYFGDLWKSLKSHPRFNQMVASRLLHADVNNLAKVLSDLSVGRQPPLWEELKECETPIMHIVGEKDLKFKQIAHQMCHEIINGRKTEVDEHKTMYEVVEVPNCGHAVHLENPLPVIRALRRFLTRVKKGSDS